MDTLNAFAPALMGFGFGGAAMQVALGIENNPAWFVFCLVLFVVGLLAYNLT